MKKQQYFIDEQKYKELRSLCPKNNGDFCEIATKYVLGFDPKKDPSTPFDIGCDIDEIKASVKSTGFTLTEKKQYLEYSDNEKARQRYIDNYFKNCVQIENIFTVVSENTITLYRLNNIEFRKMVNDLMIMTKKSESKTYQGKPRYKGRVRKSQKDIVKYIETVFAQVA